MSRRNFEMEVVFPTTHAGVRDLVQALAASLHEDAKRRLKDPKCDKRDPRIQDKLTWARALDGLAVKQEKENRKRWRVSEDEQ